MRTAWLSEAPVHPLQQALADLEHAYTNFFAQRAAFTRFKKKGRHDSLRYSDLQQIHLDQRTGRLFLPKFGWLRVRFSRGVLGTVKNFTVCHSAGYRTRPRARSTTPFPGSVRPVSTWALPASPRCWQACPTRRPTASGTVQQAMSHKQKFSRNWKKAKVRVQRLHAHIADVRRTCPCCDHRSAYNWTTQARFVCTACGHANNAIWSAQKKTKKNPLTLRQRVQSKSGRVGGDRENNTYMQAKCPIQLTNNRYFHCE